MYSALYPALNFNSGEWIGGGRGPSDLAAACERVSGGESLAQVAQEYPSAFVRNYKGLAVLRGLLKPTEATWRGPRCVFWLWGEAGTGKSRTAYDYDGLPYEPIRAGKGTVWWDGYAGQKVILFDDIRRDEVTCQQFLRWTDGRDFVGQVKGGTVGVEAHTWIFTSNHNWQNVFPDEADPAGPIARRLTYVHFFKRGDPIPQINCKHNSVTSYAVEPGNTIPVQRPAAAEPTPMTPISCTSRSPMELARLLEAVDAEVYDFCDKHGLPQCSACDPMWGSSLLK